jgi:hypothetical protein
VLGVTGLLELVPKRIRSFEDFGMRDAASEVNDREKAVRNSIAGRRELSKVL